MHIHVVHHILVNTSIYTLSRISRIRSTWRSNFNFKEVLFTKKGQEFRKKDRECYSMYQPISNFSDAHFTIQKHRHNRYS